MWDATVSRAIVRGLNAFLAVENILDTEYDTARTPLRVDRLAAHRPRRRAGNLAVTVPVQVHGERTVTVWAESSSSTERARFVNGRSRSIAARDNGYFRFGASQNPKAAPLLAQHGTSREAAQAASS